MPAFSDVQTNQDQLWRKALGTIVAWAPYSTTLLTTLLDSTTGDLKALPTGWKQLGRPTEDGITWPRETEVSELYGLGSTDPGRSDIRRVTKRVSMTLMETNKTVVELAQGVDLSGVTHTLTPASTGKPQVTWDEPELPTYPYGRLVVIARDVTSAELYIGREMPRVKVTELGEETWSDGDAAMVTPLTFTCYYDDVAGTPMRHFRGGPGFADIMTDEGWA